MSAAAARPGSVRQQPMPEPLIWHDLECGAYRADLDVWLGLARRTGGPVLDLGAGSGRVALELARAGHEVIAVDIDAGLLTALRSRAEGLPVQCVQADARRLRLTEHGLALCVIPMQTLQLLGGARERARLLSAAGRHLRPGGLVACAIVERLDPFDRDTGPAPGPDRVRHGDTVYLSRPTAVRVDAARAVLEREREIVRPDGSRELSSDVVALDLLSRRQLECELAALGMTPRRARHIPATDDHVGSTVVIAAV